MRSGDAYRDLARELLARAANHPNAQQRAKLETTAAEWLRLALAQNSFRSPHAHRNSLYRGDTGA